MRELVEIRKHMRALDRGIAKAQKDTTKEALHWSNWHSKWENTIQVDAQKQPRYVIQTKAQIRDLREIKTEIQTHILTQETNYLFMAEQLGAVAARVGNIEKKLNFAPLGNLSFSPPGQPPMPQEAKQGDNSEAAAAGIPREARVDPKGGLPDSAENLQVSEGVLNGSDF